MPKQNILKKDILNLSSCIHGGQILKNAKKYNLPKSKIIDFSTNLNPYVDPFKFYKNNLNLQEIIQESIKNINQYPDNDYIEFRKAAAKYVGGNVTKDNIIPGNGSCEVIRLVAESVIEKDDIVLIPKPTFAEYETQVKLFGANVIHISWDDVFNISYELLKKAKILFICNPNNPTGKLISHIDIEKLLKSCTDNETLLFIDEAFIELAYNSTSVADLVIDNKYLFVLRSLTKSFSIPGIRIGFGIAESQVAQSLNNVRLSWNVNSIAELMGIKLLNIEGGANSQYLIESREYIKKECEYLRINLSKIPGFKPYESSVNYILIDISDNPINSQELTHRLAYHNILVRDCNSFKSLENNYIRVAVKTRKENERLINSINQVHLEYADPIHIDASYKNTCEYYPCHFEGQDCTFCFCPFYPCEDERTGGKYIKGTKCGLVWSCMKCHLMHDTIISHKVLDILIEDGTTKSKLKKAWDTIIEVHLSAK